MIDYWLWSALGLDRYRSPSYRMAPAPGAPCLPGGPSSRLLPVPMGFGSRCRERLGVLRPASLRPSWASRARRRAGKARDRTGGSGARGSCWGTPPARVVAARLVRQRHEAGGGGLAGNGTREGGGGEERSPSAGQAGGSDGAALEIQPWRRLRRHPRGPASARVRSRVHRRGRRSRCRARIRLQHGCHRRCRVLHAPLLSGHYWRRAGVAPLAILLRLPLPVSAAGWQGPPFAPSARCSARTYSGFSQMLRMSGRSPSARNHCSAYCSAPRSECRCVTARRAWSPARNSASAPSRGR